MSHPSLSVLSIAVALWLTDIGVAHHAPALADRDALACHEQVLSPGHDGSDLELVVCANRASGCQLPLTLVAGSAAHDGGLEPSARALMHAR
jgi:hypothetical protein